MATIRIVSPSGAIDPQWVDGAATRLAAWGYDVQVAKHALTKQGRFAGSDAERLEDLNEALQDEAVDAVLCSRGGYGMQRIVDKVVPIKKPIIGFSDITELHQLALKAGQKSLHGLMCKHLATLPEACGMVQDYRQMLAYLLGVDGAQKPPMRFRAHPLNRGNEPQGRIVGGNLSVLYGLQGTPFGLDHLLREGDVLFLEDIAERHYHIDRMIRNLRLSGVLARLGGLIVGQMSDCDDDASMGCTVYETIREAVEDYDYPLRFDYPAGHVEENYPIVMG